MTDKRLAGAEALVQRVLPRHARQVRMELIPAGSGRDVYEISGEEGGVLLRGNSGGSIAAALGWYLRSDAKVHLSWCGSRVELPERLPCPAPCRRVIEQKYRSYFNYCTFNYSASWWDWPRWEKELDLMALNGVNLPLSAVGIECAWYETLLELGFSEDEARNFFSGPAFLAWQWMTNIEGFAGPLPESWIPKRKVLAQQIIRRQRELGMTPIQQGFSGFVPRLLREKLPNARIQMKSDWCGIEGTAQLDPTDPEFRRIGTIFLEKQRELFGSYGFYAADPFHEGEPPDQSEDYLRRVGQAVDGLIQSFDPDGIWVMQSWSIRKEIACAVPKERLLVLDLAGTGTEKHGGFWGIPFLTGNLHNFGGRTVLHGDLRQLAENRFVQLRREYPNVCGAGLFMEGINQNPVYYDLAFEMLTRNDSVELTPWLARYADRRYGRPGYGEAWALLADTAYAPGTNGVEKSSILCARPAVTVKKSGPNDGLHLPYGNRRLLRALTELLRTPSASEGYRYDVTDLLRQILSNYGQKLYVWVREAFLNRDRTAFQGQSQAFLALLLDVDRLLSLRPEFRLEEWIRSARALGDTPEERRQLEYSAGLLLTLWGEEDEPQIFDYAWREWSGLIGTFYYRRWKLFFDYLDKILETGKDYFEDALPQVYGREAFRANDCYVQMADFEAAWLHEEKRFPPPETDFDAVVGELLEKYRGRI